MSFARAVRIQTFDAGGNVNIRIETEDPLEPIRKDALDRFPDLGIKTDNTWLAQRSGKKARLAIGEMHPDEYLPNGVVAVIDVHSDRQIDLICQEVSQRLQQMLKQALVSSRRTGNRERALT